MGFFVGRKKIGGCGDHTRVHIANARQNTQFSLGKANLPHHAPVTSGF
jgi:hypothetical protein